MTQNSFRTMEWNISVPIFTTPVIVKQMAVAIGIPFGIVILFLLVMSDDEDRIYALYGVGLILMLLFLTFVLILLIYGGRYTAQFIVSGKGIGCYTYGRQRKINRFLNGLTVFLGLIGKNPTAAGAGMLAQSRQSIFLPWKEVKKVKYRKKQKTIILCGGFGRNIAVFCTTENYEAVEEAVRVMIGYERKESM